VQSVRDVVAFELTVFPEREPAAGAADIASVGSILTTKPVINAVVSLSEREFQLVVAMATTGRLASVF